MYVVDSIGHVVNPVWNGTREFRGTIALRLIATLIVAFSALLTVHVIREPQVVAAAPPAPHALQGPFYLEKNVGQAPSTVAFLAHTSRGVLYLLRDGGVLAPTASGVTRMTPAAAANAPHIMASQKLPGIVNRFIGNNSSHWFTNIPTYERVTYRNVYPGVDLTFHGQHEQLEYDWIVRPGADPGQVRLAFGGTGTPTIVGHGTLRVGNGAVLETRPTVYQQGGEVRQFVDGGYVLAGRHTVGIRVGQYDHSRTLIIDPVMMFSEYLGGTDDDKPSHVQVDGKGNIYVTGTTSSPHLPTENAYRASWAGKVDMFVIKFNPNGGIAYSTYVGGSGNDIASGIAVDGSGQASVVGNTASTDFPTMPQATFPGGQAAVILSLSAGGNALRYSLLQSSGGGSASVDNAQTVAIDGQGNAYVALGMDSTGKGPDVIGLVEIDANGPSGPNTKAGRVGLGWDGTPLGIAVCNNGDVVVVGGTDVTNFPTFNATQSAYGGNQDGFVTEVDPSLKKPIFSTFLGGSGLDSITAVAVDSSNNIYVAGTTLSANFPEHTTLGVAGGFSPFVAKFAGSGQILYNTVVGTSSVAGSTSIVVNKQGYATIGGATAGNSFTAVHPLRGQESFRGGNWDGFVATLGGAGKRILFSSYLGGRGDDFVNGLAFGGAGNLFVTGFTNSANFPKTRGGAFNSSGKDDGFLMKIGNK